MGESRASFRAWQRLPQRCAERGAHPDVQNTAVSLAAVRFTGPLANTSPEFMRHRIAAFGKRCNSLKPAGET